MADRPGCLATLERPSCFGFLLFVALWLGLCGAADLAGPRLHHRAEPQASTHGQPG